MGLVGIMFLFTLYFAVLSREGLLSHELTFETPYSKMTVRNFPAALENLSLTCALSVLKKDLALLQKDLACFSKM